MKINKTGFYGKYFGLGEHDGDQVFIGNNITTINDLFELAKLNRYVVYTDPILKFITAEELLNFPSMLVLRLIKSNCIFEAFVINYNW